MTFNEIIHQNKPVLVDFYADWCAPCRTQAPILKQVKDQLGEAVSIIKINVDKNPAAAQTYQVSGIPTLILFKKGQPVWRQSGVVQAGILTQVIKNYS
ncbi:MAG: thioredoxin [Ferruginibacter sp.]